ncbi:hypothetical protein DU976_01245 [Vibrio navarrensis]|uniref:hypothetical protein n=1 Tax=Vibrio navarrensis TaxID=29495 RepID=UPI001302B7BF|nr:hypothetical protein [Vibrio navarrensis]EGR2794522.1 hypothetical protein [Vibrio navarrensis]EHA1124524.1 hypothetical protein [Vibrio navarrensis]
MKKQLFTAIPLTLLMSFPSIAATSSTVIGDVYSDQMGKSLYTFDKDPVGKSVCMDDCEKFWPPLLVNEQNQSVYMNSQGFSIITRPDGTKQWALNGKPLYRWIKDTKSGDIEGAGIKGVWPLARADDVSIKLFNDGKRRYLVDENYLTLYTFDKDKVNESVCFDDCAVNWPPATLDEKLAKKELSNLKLTGGFGLIEREKNIYQWTYEGKPLYRWVKDSKAGDTKGDGINGVWHLIIK